MIEKSIEQLRHVDYPVKIAFDPREEVYTADFFDLPGCSADGNTVEEAYQRAAAAKNEWLKVTIDQGLKVPEPTKTSDSSGRILLRLPTSLHATLADKAQIFDSSLNQYIVYLLSSAMVGQTVEQKLEELNGYVLGCHARLNQLTSYVGTLTTQMMLAQRANYPAQVLDTVPLSTVISDAFCSVEAGQKQRLLEASPLWQ